MCSGYVTLRPLGEKTVTSHDTMFRTLIYDNYYQHFLELSLLAPQSHPGK